MPISQVLYAMIVMNAMRGVFNNAEVAVNDAGFLMGIGMACGMAEMLSAWMQGTVGAAGIRALSEGEGKGLAFIIIAMGIVETVGIFAMVFLFIMIPAT
jgi:F0F1-type ATP synthase membrane subunit c/vacuolar-type H+-ATPase subunit K